jgi:hypothetical protein
MNFSMSKKRKIATRTLENRTSLIISIIKAKTRISKIKIGQSIKKTLGMSNQIKMLSPNSNSNPMSFLLNQESQYV